MLLTSSRPILANPHLFNSMLTIARLRVPVRLHLNDRWLALPVAQSRNMMNVVGLW